MPTLFAQLTVRTPISENAFFSHNIKISTLSHTSICQVPLVSLLSHFPVWSPACGAWAPVMIKSLKWMALVQAVDIFTGENSRWCSAASNAHACLSCPVALRAAHSSKHESQFIKQVLPALCVCINSSLVCVS